MGQAKARGSFEERQQEAIRCNDIKTMEQRKRLAEERFALNEWRRENPTAAAAAAEAKLRMQLLVATTVGLSVGTTY